MSSLIVKCTNSTNLIKKLGDLNVLIVSIIIKILSVVYDECKIIDSILFDLSVDFRFLVEVILLWAIT